MKPGYQTQILGQLDTGPEGRLSLEVSADGRYILVRMLYMSAYAYPQASSFIAVPADALIRSLRSLAGSDEL